MPVPGFRLALKAARGLYCVHGAVRLDLERRRVRCVFSQCLNDNALEVGTGAPPGGPPGNVSGGRRWRAVARFFGSAVDDVVATVFPADCRMCGGPLAGTGSLPVCDACVSRIQPQPMTLCERCGEALDMDGLRFVQSQMPAVMLLCRPCRQVAPVFERAVAYGVYRDELRDMVHLLKYEGLRQIAGLLARRLVATMVATLDGAAKELTVVAVPLYPAKERARGFNQSVLIAEAVIREMRRNDMAWKLRLDRSALRRVRDTESQFALSPKQRRANLRGAFVVRNDVAIRNREVLLVDDIYTTGATARECARVLREAGATKVWVATVSRAQPEMVEMWSGSDVV